MHIAGPGFLGFKLSSKRNTIASSVGSRNGSYRSDLTEKIESSEEHLREYIDPRAVYKAA